MIIVKENTLERIKEWSDDSIYVLTDFDRTITAGNSDTSWGILSKSDMVPKEYVNERQELYNYYRPYEIDETLDYETKNRLMSEWWNKHIGLLIKYQMSEEVINEAARNLRVMSFRDGAKEFLENMRDRNIPIIIISAGIGNFIKQFLINNNCDFDNIFIVSNFINFKNGIAVGFNDAVIYPMNKNEVFLPDNIKELIKNRPNAILLGDSISDIRMAKEVARANALKIGFLEEKIEENIPYYREAFDVVCTNNTSYGELVSKIKILKR